MTHATSIDPRLLDAVAEAWRRGWRPADVLHALRQAAPTLTGLAAAVVLAGVETLGAGARVTAEERARLRETAERHGATARQEARATYELLLLLRQLPTLPHLGGPAERAAGDAAADVRTLRRVRALLAKAESTDFPDEAEALTAKAQELMSAHALDASLVAGAPPPTAADARERRVHVDGPYLEAKMQLLAATGAANGVRMAWFRSVGIAVLVGLPADLDAVELLFTSLLVQATRALAGAGVGGTHGRTPARTRAFRRAFLLAYAQRIGERLAAGRRSADAAAAADRGVDLAPVLRARAAAVDRAFTALFPGVRSRRSTSVDASGWWAGRSAADAADLARRRALPS